MKSAGELVIEAVKPLTVNTEKHMYTIYVNTHRLYYTHRRVHTNTPPHTPLKLIKMKKVTAKSDILIM